MCVFVCVRERGRHFNSHWPIWAGLHHILLLLMLIRRSIFLYLGTSSSPIHQLNSWIWNSGKRSGITGAAKAVVCVAMTLQIAPKQICLALRTLSQISVKDKDIIDRIGLISHIWTCRIKRPNTHRRGQCVCVCSSTQIKTVVFGGRQRKEMLQGHPAAAVNQHTPPVCGTILFPEDLFFLIIENGALN